jgi:NAD(P)-dependent dehydrogenase (short-subunit alcohol dehydrogenase family)
MLLPNKNAVIYGGGGAIGGAVARVFAREGARVFIAGRTRAGLDAVAADIAAALNAVSVMHDQGTLLADLSLEEFMRPIDGFLRTLFRSGSAPGVAAHRTPPYGTASEPGMSRRQGRRGRAPARCAHY